MGTTETYRKDGSGNILVRVVKTQKDIHDKIFTIQDTEKQVNHKRALRRLKQALKETRDELAELQATKTMLVDKITAIETARDS